MIDEIVKLINYIAELHKSFSKDFFSKHRSYNLRATTVKKVVNEKAYDTKFITLVDDYIEELAIFQILNTFQSSNPKIETRFRGKNRDSALNKLYYYRFGREDPNFPIQKFLNDLLGFRLILNNDFDCEELLEKISSSSKLECELFRPYIRVNKGYSAIHIYFRSGDNTYFPWELQIWKKSEEKSNELSHKNHKEKRKYINWTEIYKDNKYGEE